MALVRQQPQPGRSRQRLFVTITTVALMVVTFLSIAATEAEANTASPTQFEANGIASINSYRSQNGLPALKVNGSLQGFAKGHADELAARKQLSHDPATFDECRAAAADYSNCGENIGRVAGSPDTDQGIRTVIGNWENSPSHRTNLLCDCTHLGLGATWYPEPGFGGGRWVVVLRVFKSPTASSIGGGGTSPTTAPPTATAPPQPSGSFSTAQEFVKAVFQDFLGRQPSSSELSYWEPRVATAAGRDGFVRNYAYSTEYIGFLIDNYYRVALGRSADQAGKEYWAGIIRNRQMSPAQVAAYFYASQEYFARSQSSLPMWVSDLYTQLLKRTADTAGRDHWVSVAQQRGRVVVASNFYDSRESLNVRVDNLYRYLLGRASDPGGRTYWGDQILRSGNDVDLAAFLATSPEYLNRSGSRY